MLIFTLCFCGFAVLCNLICRAMKRGDASLLARLKASKLARVFARAFVPFGEAPLIKIGLLQVAGIFAFAALFLSVILFLNAPENNDISGAQILSGELVSYERHRHYKSDYCDIEIRTSEGELERLRSGICRDEMQFRRGERVSIWYKRDLMHPGEIRIYQLKFEKDKGYLIEFNEGRRDTYLKTAAGSLFVLALCLALIYALNTDEAREAYERKKQKGENTARSMETKYFKKR